MDFEKKKLKKIFKTKRRNQESFLSRNLFRPIVVQKMNLHLSNEKPSLTNAEIKIFSKSLFVDAILNKILPTRFFGSLCIIVKK